MKTEIVKWKKFFENIALPLINSDEIDSEYSLLSLSFFDHCLSEEEARSALMIYKQLVVSEQKNVYMDFEQKMLSFFSEILKKTAIYTVENNERRRIDNYQDFTKIADTIALNKLIMNALRKERLCQFIIPEYQCVILSGFDLTWSVIQINPHSLVLQEIVKKSKLYFW